MNSTQMMIVKVAAISAAIFLACFWSYQKGRTTEHQEWSAKWMARDLADAQAAIQFTEQQRRIELQRQGAIDAIQEQAQQDIDTAQRNAAIAAAESDRLQHGIEQAIAQIRAGGSNTSTTTSSTARDKASVLLAELFREIDTAAGNYAAEADRAYDAGRRCEAAYNAVRATSQQ